jgi:hypothetical protein
MDGPKQDIKLVVGLTRQWRKRHWKPGSQQTGRAA